MKSSLSLAEARRLALVAQGFTFPKREGKANWTKISNTITQLNLLQIDSVNVLVRSHYLPVFSRLGHYDHATLDARSFSNKKRTMFECWSHEASLVPLELHPLMRWRMNRALNGNGTYSSMNAFARDESDYVKRRARFRQAQRPDCRERFPRQRQGRRRLVGLEQGQDGA